MIVVFTLFVASFNIISSLQGDFYLYDGVFNNANSILAGFGDFNADKRVDVFGISDDGQSVDVWLAQWDGKFSRKTIIKKNSTDTSSYISGIILTDFDGDGFLDVLCNNIGKTHKLDIYWGSSSGLSTNIQPDMDVLGEPVLFDYNGDGLPDLLVKESQGSQTVLLSLKNQTFEITKFPSQNGTLSAPHSSAFVNVTPSANIDLVLTMSDGVFHIFTDNNFFKFESYKLDDVSGKIGQSSFGDLNQDGIIDHVVPVGRKIMVRSKNTWHIMAELPAPYEFDYSNEVSPKQDVVYSIPVTFIPGDYDSDGHLDFLTIVKKNNQHIPLLMKNVPCNQQGMCSLFGRTLDFQELPDTPGEVKLASFFDYMEDGSLDILLTTVTSNSSGTEMHMTLLKNTITADTCFLKVTVTNGLLEKFPLHDNKPYGVNTPGPTVFYETIKTNGGAQKSCASQLTQSAHFSLQLPYVLLGLGQTPNFVETITITLPHKHNQSVRLKQWTQIVPNSQLIVNPYPLDDSRTWTMQLFVMPSKQIYTTAAVLGSTCVGLVFIVGGLLWKENKDDKAEKKQESHRFNFDAM